VNSALTPDELLQLKQQYLIPGVYHFYREPPHLVRGEGVFLYGHDGRQYLDFYSGVSVNALGHADAEVCAAVAEQFATLAHTTTIYLTQPMLELAQTLAEITPDGLQQTFFCADGSGANETAVLLARNATGRRGIVSLSTSLHGNTALTTSLTGLSFWRTNAWPDESVLFAPSPYCYRCPLSKTFSSCGLACAAELEKTIQSTGEPPAALIFEPVQGNGGIVVPPAEYVERIKEIAAEYGILLIADEIQTGFGRTGRMFASEHFGLEPDIMTVAKAMGGGLPAAAVIATEKVAGAFKGPRASTFGGNLTTMKAGLTVIRAIRERGLVENAAEVGDYLKNRLLELKERHPLIGDVRGLGLMLGVELVQPDNTPASDVMDNVLEALKDDGIFVGKTGAGRNVVTLQPPLTVTQDHADQVVTALDRALDG